MRRVRGIAHQNNRHSFAIDHLVVHPAFAHHTRKADPVGRPTQVRRIGHQRMAVQVFGKQFFAKSGCLVLAHRVQPVRLPHLLGCLDDKGRRILVKFIRMHCKPAVLGTLKAKGKCVKGLLSAQPYKAALAQVNIRFKRGSVAGTNAAVQAVACDDQVGIVLRSQGLVIIAVHLKHQLHAQLLAARLQNVQQVLASNAAEAMACRTNGFAFKEYFDIVPVVQRVAYQLARHWVG